MVNVNYQLVVGNNCNYHCSYCFQHGKYSREQHGLDSIMLDNIDSFYNIFFNHYEKMYHHQSLSLIGGEPLLPENKDLLAAIFKKWDNKEFVITTNGTYIYEYYDILKAHNIEYIVSIDGAKPLHSKYRITDDDSAFDKTLNGIKLLVDSGANVTIATVFHPDDLRSYSDFFDLLDSIGWGERKNLSLSLNYEIKNGSDDISIQDYDKSVNSIFNLISLDERAMKADFSSFFPSYSKFIKSNIEHFSHDRVSHYSCGRLITPSYSFLPDGTVTLCNLSNSEALKIGTYYPEVSIDFDFIEKLNKRAYELPDKCKTCVYRNLCSGGCPACAAEYHGSALEPHCGLWEYPDVLLSSLARYLEYLRSNRK